MVGFNAGPRQAEKASAGHGLDNAFAPKAAIPA
jgi:hypothetical protein